MGLMEAVGSGPVALDTSIFIYFLERDPRYLSSLRPMFEAIAAGRLPAVTSGITLLESLVVPLRAGDLALAERYESLLTRSRGLRMIDLDRDVLRGAAQLRAMRPSLQNGVDDYYHQRMVHRAIATTSMVVSGISYLMMLFGGGR